MKRVLYLLLALLAADFLTLFLHGWLTDWSPGTEPVPLALTQTSSATTVSDSILRFVTWNVGYGGLGAESDFSYDDAGMWVSGSSMVRSPRPRVTPTQPTARRDAATHARRSRFFCGFGRAW